jgi:hypothetical protein
MKIWIDKHGGMHYHKKDCKILTGIPALINPDGTAKHPAIIFPYEEIEHRIRINHNTEDYADIIVDGVIYRRCPMCFDYPTIEPK